MQDYADMPMDYENWDSIDDVFFIMQMLSEFEGPRTKDGSPNVPTKKFLVCLKKDAAFWKEIIPILIDEKRLTEKNAKYPRNRKIIEGERNRILDFFEKYYHITPGCHVSEKRRAWADFHRRYQGNRGMQELIALDKRLFPCICARFSNPRKYTNDILKLLIIDPDELVRIYQESENIDMRRILRDALYLYYENFLKAAHSTAMYQKRISTYKKTSTTTTSVWSRKYEENMTYIVQIFEIALDTVDLSKSKLSTWVTYLIDHRISDYIKNENTNYKNEVSLDNLKKLLGEGEQSEADKVEIARANSRMRCSIQKERARKCIEYIKHKLESDIQNQRRSARSRNADTRILEYIILEEKAIEMTERECAELELCDGRIKKSDFAKTLNITERQTRNYRKTMREMAKEADINDRWLSYDLDEGEDNGYDYLFPPKRRRKKVE